MNVITISSAVHALKDRLQVEVEFVAHSKEIWLLPCPYGEVINESKLLERLTATSTRAVSASHRGMCAIPSS